MSKKKQPNAPEDKAAPGENAETEVRTDEAAEAEAAPLPDGGPEGNGAPAPEETPPSQPENQDRAEPTPAETGPEPVVAEERYLRLAAEYDNYRKRTQKERQSLYTEAAASVAERFLPVYDNLERALAQQTEDAAFYRGVEMIRDGLLAVFAQLDIRPIEALGRPFDPALHDAVMHIQDDSGEENTVAEVFQSGFAMDGRVIRHAMVKVKN